MTIAEDNAVEVEVPLRILVRVGVTGQGPTRPVEVNQTKITVRELLEMNDVTVSEGHSVSVNGSVVDLDHEIDLGDQDPSAVPVVLVAPRVSNG
jgi:hypothetical protein